MEHPLGPQVETIEYLNYSFRIQTYSRVLIKDWFIKNLKFIYSEKAKKCCDTSTVDLSYVVTVKSTVEILQNFVTFS